MRKPLAGLRRRLDLARPEVPSLRSTLVLHHDTEERIPFQPRFLLRDELAEITPAIRSLAEMLIRKTVEGSGKQLRLQRLDGGINNRSGA